ncbi:hypothetical protein PRZ48_004613 [Zasmidium cellare]|uniref:Uncharacterized protein n=1 Tax=Zasmidium cellare TaxID=395010 RepID=A0ABR0ERH4_ZASCE|nr:hypothetical protein PRZ48_004613 [Zasmidium cellare]
MAASTLLRLEDFPSEIRNRIYSLALAGQGNTRQVADFDFPCLTRASRAIRQDTLPIFFAESNFVFTVGTNAFCKPGSTDDDGHDIAAQSKKRSGTLGFKPVVQQFIKDAGQAAIFRHVTFDIQEALEAKNIRYGSDTITMWSLLHINLIVENAHVRMEVVEGNYHPGRDGGSQGGLELLDKAVERVTGIVKDIESRQGFKGFTMKDMHRIARVFRIDFG